MSKAAVITLIFIFTLVLCGPVCLCHLFIFSRIDAKHTLKRAFKHAKANSKVHSFAKAKKGSYTSPDGAKRQGGSTDYFNANDPADARGDIDVTNLDSNNSNNLSPDDKTGQNDCTTALQEILNHVSTISGKPVIYFPAGKYLIASNLVIKGKVALMGSTNGISLFHTESANTLSTTISYQGIATDDSVDVDRLFFDGVRLEFGQDRVTISHCVFFSNEVPSTHAKLSKGQVHAHIDNNMAHRPALGHSFLVANQASIDA